MSVFILIKDPNTQKIGCLIQSQKESILEFSTIKEAQSKWQNIQFSKYDISKKELFEKAFLCFYEPRVVETDTMYLINNIHSIQKSECPLFIIRNVVFSDIVGQELWNNSVPLNGKW